MSRLARELAQKLWNRANTGTVEQGVNDISDAIEADRREQERDASPWNEAIEASAKLMERRQYDVDTNHWSSACRLGATAIRTLKKQPT